MQNKSLKKLGWKAGLGIIGYLALKWAVILLLGGYLYRNGLWRNEYFLFFPLLAIIVFYIRKRRKQRITTSG